MAKTRSYKTNRRRKTSSWRKLQLSRQLKHRLKVLALAVVVVFSTLIVTAAVQLYHYFTKPLATASGSSSETTVFTGRRFNLLLVSLEDVDDPGSMITKLAVLTLNGAQKQVFMVELPLSAESDVPQGFGIHQLDGVYALGALSKPRANLDLTAQTVSRLLAVPIDGYLLTDASSPNPLLSLLSLRNGRSLEILPEFINQLRWGVKTNLTFPSLLQIGKLIWASSFDSWTIAIGELVDVVALDQRLDEIFADDRVVEERLKVVVLNATEQPGLATHVARYVTNLGGDVIKVNNFESQREIESGAINFEGGELGKSILVAADQDLYSVKRLVEVLGIEEVRSTYGGLEERAEITLILGLDSYYNL